MADTLFSTIVAAVKGPAIDYPNDSFGPAKQYSELKKTLKPNAKNKVYDRVRQALIQLQLDKDNANTPDWNPFKDLVKKGQHVVLKPNLVLDRHPLGKKGIISMITHASVLAPIIDYVLLATDNDCRITICDVPLQHANWEKLLENTRLNQLQKEYKALGVTLHILDLRHEVSVTDKQGIIVSREKKIRDPLGYAIVKLGQKSEFKEIADLSEKLTITGYGVSQDKHDRPDTHHNKRKNEYFIAKTILDADLFINVPKLKTHKKTGITCALKNLIGINGDKSWIAHHRKGSVSTGGDEFPKYRLWTHTKYRLYEYLQGGPMKRKIASALVATYVFIFHGGRAKKNKNVLQSKGMNIIEGSWHGNDTLWRSVKDLNKIVLYADKNGEMKEKPQRNYLCIVDGIIGGEGEGPMMQLPKKAGIIVAGTNAVYVDACCATIMGFNWNKIPMVAKAFENRWWPLVHKNGYLLHAPKNITTKFKPPFNWRSMR